MTSKLVLAMLLSAALPTAVMAMCPGKSQKVVQSCAAGEVVNPASGHCEKPVSS